MSQTGTDTTMFDTQRCFEGRQVTMLARRIVARHVSTSFLLQMLLLAFYPASQKQLHSFLMQIMLLKSDSSHCKKENSIFTFLTFLSDATAAFGI